MDLADLRMPGVSRVKKYAVPRLTGRSAMARKQDVSFDIVALRTSLLRTCLPLFTSFISVNSSCINLYSWSKSMHYKWESINKDLLTLNCNPNYLADVWKYHLYFLQIQFFTWPIIIEVPNSLLETEHNAGFLVSQDSS